MGERDIRPDLVAAAFRFLSVLHCRVGREDPLAGAARSPFDDTTGGRSDCVLPDVLCAPVISRVPTFRAATRSSWKRRRRISRGPWEVANMRKYAPNMGYGVGPLPVPDSHRGPVLHVRVTSRTSAIFSTTSHPEAAGSSWLPRPRRARPAPPRDVRPDPGAQGPAHQSALRASTSSEIPS